MATGKQLANEARKLVTEYRQGEIPYVNNGSSLRGMDCQGLVEYCLDQLGITKNWKGSNHMWRTALSWKGTPEECKKEFGTIPVGALLFILKFDGGEIRRGYTDGLGNAEHVGVYTAAGAGAVAASSSRGCVIDSRFKGRQINGGWNRIGLLSCINYGQSQKQEADIQETPQDTEPGHTGYSPKYYKITVRRGDKGGAVRELQLCLTMLGFEANADGVYGPQTESAVTDYQMSRGLAADGICGKMTWATIKRETEAL